MVGLTKRVCRGLAVSGFLVGCSLARGVANKDAGWKPALTRVKHVLSRSSVKPRRRGLASETPATQFKGASVVNPRLIQVIALIASLVAVASGVSSSASAGDARTAEDFAEALAAGDYPWYDQSEDAFRPLNPPRDRSPRDRSNVSLRLPSLGLAELGQLLVFLILAAGLAALIVILVRYYQPNGDEKERPAPSRRHPEVVGRASNLPSGLELEEGDPWESARRLRAAGDFRRAVVALFAHQLLELERLGLIRMTPGRTGRQLVRSIPDVAIRRSVSRTLPLFEEVYYGHREPSAEEFERLWREAERLQDRWTGGGAP